MEKILLNLSNHPSQKWDNNQRKDWDKIIDIEFPNIDPEATEEAISKLAYKYYHTIKGIINAIINNTKSSVKIKLMLMGEYSFCYSLFTLIKTFGLVDVVIPTTKRDVVEQVDKEGKVTTKKIFRFIKWREVA